MVVSFAASSNPGLEIEASVSEPEINVDLYGDESVSVPSETASFFTPAGMLRIVALPLPSLAIESEDSSFERTTASPE